MKETFSYSDLLGRLCRMNVRRIDSLKEILYLLELSYYQLTTGSFHHIILFLDQLKDASPQWVQKAFLAHYDRVSGSPGATDNGAAVIQLLLFARSLKNRGESQLPLIILSDGEELNDSQKFSEQGSFYLGQALKESSIPPIVFFVFDMCGIGATPVWSLGAGSVQKDWRLLLKEQFQRFCGGHDLECPLLFSDNAGLTLSGWPSVLISLLPHKQARELQQVMNGSGVPPEKNQATVGEWIKTLKENIPDAWSFAHSLNDRPELIEFSAFERIERLLGDLHHWQIPQSMIKDSRLSPDSQG